MSAKDHKRKSRHVDAATVTVSDGEIVVVVPDVLGKNESHRRAGKVMHTSSSLKLYRESVRLGVDGWRSGETTMSIIDGRMSTVCDSQAMDGAWRVEVIGVWPRQRATIDGRPVDFGACPMGDADAAIPQALDALQHAGILDDDARVVEVRAWNLYRKDQRATIIRLVRVPDLAERDAAIAHLIGHVPKDITPTPPRSRRKVKVTS